MILAGDIGGTKTILAIFDEIGGQLEIVTERKFASREYENFDEIVRKLFEEIAPRYSERSGGYTRMLKLGRREGDSSEMVILELVE